MATKTQSTEVTQQKKVYVKSEAVLDEMEVNGQLKPFTDYYTDDEQDTPFMPIGLIFASAIPQEDARVHLLDGSTISQDGVYADFANLIKKLKNDGHNIVYEDDENSTAEQKFDADVTATGNCGKFIIDDVNRTIRLPKITTFIQGLNNITDIGSSLSAGLPNITGSLNVTPDANNAGMDAETTGSGAITRIDVKSTGSSVGGSGWGVWGGFSFDASNSNSIYGNSETVQPPATRYPYYIVLASGYKSSQVIDIDNVVSDVNNVKNELNEKTRDYIVKSEPTSTGWFIKWASGLKEYWGVSIINDGDTHNISFSEAFASTNYAISFSPITENTSTDIIAGKVYQTVSSVRIIMSYRSMSAQGSATVNISYHAKGF